MGNTKKLIYEVSTTFERTISIKQYISNVILTLQRIPIEKIDQIVDVLEETRQKAKYVYIFGNGGSSSTASHFAADLAKGAICPGKSRIKAFALTDNIPLCTAWANDSAYDYIFAEQLENHIEPGDIAIGISGSGNSPNVLNGIKAAKGKGATTIGFAGFNGGKLKDIVDIPIVIDNYQMEQVEDIHLLLEHVITMCLRNETNQ